MRPLTDSIPKPLVKIKDKAIIDYSIEKLSKISAVQKIVVNGFYLADEIEGHLKNLRNPKIIFSREVEKIETGGGLAYALENKIVDPNLPILLVNGDVLWEDVAGISDVEEICEAYSANDCDIMLGLKKNGEVLGYEGQGDFLFDAKSLALYKKDDVARSHVFVGTQVVHPRIFLGVSEKCFSMNYFYKKALTASGLLEGIKGFELKGRYFHIGDVASIALVEGALKG